MMQVMIIPNTTIQPNVARVNRLGNAKQAITHANPPKQNPTIAPAENLASAGDTIASTTKATKNNNNGMAVYTMYVAAFSLSPLLGGSED